MWVKFKCIVRIYLDKFLSFSNNSPFYQHNRLMSLSATHKWYCLLSCQGFWWSVNSIERYEFLGHTCNCLWSQYYGNL